MLRPITSLLMSSAGLTLDATPTAIGSRGWLVAACLFLVTVALYGRAIGFQFITFDDYKYVVDNSQIYHGLTPATVTTAFTTIFFVNYSPLLILTELAISTLFGTGPAGFHGTNVLLHAANVALVFFFLVRTGGRLWVAAFAAALWGWHPLRVESVAWVSELKDVLCGFFCLITLLLYLSYTRRPNWWAYLLVLFAYVLALGSKPMAVTLPCVLLLLDIYPLRRFSNSQTPEQTLRRTWIVIVLEKLPMIGLAAVLSRVTMLSQSKSIASFPLTVRLANAVVSIADYLRDTLVPRQLSVFYPHPETLGHSIPILAVILSSGLLAILLTGAVWLAVRWRPAALIGLLWFLGMLVPVIGIIQPGEQARADRYTYLPTLGLIAAGAWIISSFLNSKPAIPARIVVLIGLAAATVLGVEGTIMEHQLSFWKNSKALFTHAIAVTQSNYLAYYEVANQQILEHHNKQALHNADQALHIRPTSKGAWVTRSLALMAMDKYEPALVSIRIAARISPNDPVVRRHFAQILVKLNQPTQAATQFQKSLKLDPNDPTAHEEYATLLANEHQWQQARAQWNAALLLNPGYAHARAGLAKLDYLQGNLSAAQKQYRLAVQAAGREAKEEWLLNLAWLEATGSDSSPTEIDDSLARATIAVPNPATASPLALDTLAAALARNGQYDRAAALAHQAAVKARTQSQPAFAASIESRMRAYQKGEPYLTRH